MRERTVRISPRSDRPPAGPLCSGSSLQDPVGPENDAHLIEMAKTAAIVIFAYGQPCHATLRTRGLALARLLMKEAGVTPHTLRLAKNGTPWHPLYLPETLKPVVWKL
jgi:hypothetical protein